MRVTFVSYHGALGDAALECGWDVEVLNFTDVRDVPLLPGTAYVSPANSLGFMDGGIDYVYSRIMFPGLEADVKRAIADHGGNTSKLGRPFLPIGRALVVPVTPPGVYMVVAPTMLMPHDVRGTHNAYHATYAALKAACDHGNITRLIIPGMCTGCGMMGAAEAVGQMKRAHDDFLAGRPPAWTPEQIVAEQPPWYENTEFFDIPPSRVRVCAGGGATTPTTHDQDVLGPYPDS